MTIFKKNPEKKKLLTISQDYYFKKFVYEDKLPLYNDRSDALKEFFKVNTCLYPEKHNHKDITCQPIKKRKKKFKRREMSGANKSAALNNAMCRQKIFNNNINVKFCPCCFLHSYMSMERHGGVGN